MTTNHDALREALEIGRDAAYEVAQRYHQEMAGYRPQAHKQKDADVAKIETALAALSQPMPEAAAQGWKDGDTAKLVNDLRDVAVQFHDAQQLRERIAHIIRPLTDRLSASPAAPAQPKVHDDAALAALGWQRISCPVCGADGARAAPAQPQAQTTSPDDIHSCGEFCDLPECVAAREAQAQGESEFADLLDQLEDARIAAGTHDTTAGSAIGKAIQLLQSHREAVDEITRRFEELKRHGVARHVYDEAIAQHRAALEECKDTLEASTDQTIETDEFFKMVDAAIQQANQVLEGTK